MCRWFLFLRWCGGFGDYLLRLQSVEFFFKVDTLRPLCFKCSENHVRVMPVANSCGSYRSVFLLCDLDFKEIKYIFSLWLTLSINTMTGVLNK